MTLPPTLRGLRLRLFLWLVLNGLLQASLSLAGVLAFDRLSASRFTDGMPLAVVAICAGLIFQLRILQRRHGERFALDYVNETRELLMRKLLSLPADATVRLGLVTTRLGSDLLALKSWLAEGFATSIVMGVSLVALIAGAAVLYPVVAVAITGITLLWGLAVFLLLSPLRRSVAEVRKLRGRLSAQAGDQIAARLTLAHFGRTSPEIGKLSKRSEALARALVRRATWTELIRSVPEWALPVAALTGFLLAGTGAGAAPLILLASLTAGTLSRLSRAADLYVASALAYSRFSDVLKAPGLADPGTEDAPARGVPVALSFTVEDGAGATLRHDLPPGTLAVLSGGTPADRSRLLQALARLRDDTAVTAAIGERSAGKIALRDWRRIVSYCGPQLPLLRGTLGDNIALGAPSRSADEEMLALASEFGLADTADGMKRHIDPAATPPDEAFRIRLARALARRSAVIVIDEAIPAGEETMLHVALARAQERGVTVILSGTVAGLPASARYLPVRHQLAFRAIAGGLGKGG